MSTVKKAMEQVKLLEEMCTLTKELVRIRNTNYAEDQAKRDALNTLNLGKHTLDGLFDALDSARLDLSARVNDAEINI